MISSVATQAKRVYVCIELDLDLHEPPFEEIAALSRLLNGDDFFNATDNAPHVNLYDFELPEDSVDRLVRVLRTIAAKNPKQILDVNGVNYFPFDAVYIAVGKNEQLSALEEEVVRSCSLLRDGTVPDIYGEPGRSLTNEQFENRKKYGNPYVLSAYVPHLTLGFLNAGDELMQAKCDELQARLQVKRLSFGTLNLLVSKDGANIVTESFSLSS